MHANTFSERPFASLTRCLFFSSFFWPSVHLFQRTNTPDSTEEPLSPFHCSLSSTIELTRWRDKLEQKLNAHWGGMGDREPLFLSKTISLTIRSVSRSLSSNMIQHSRYGCTGQMDFGGSQGFIIRQR